MWGFGAVVGRDKKIRKAERALLGLALALFFKNMVEKKSVNAHHCGYRVNPPSRHLMGYCCHRCHQSRGCR